MLTFGHLLALGGGILWGISTPLMKGQSSHLVSWQRKSEEQQKSFLLHALGVLTSLACSWKFLACFGLNQLGSVLYTASLSYNPITISVPISNSVNLAIIVLVGCYKEKITLNWRSTAGVLLVMMGVILCLLAPNHSQTDPK
ncbi:hypothetical protein TYRP_017954 [Tyrophagus putrescentiae]|nr:hypothetical protein TYRP_017954 [Tyrophagus putrescentiae]